MRPSILFLQYTNPANYPPLQHAGMILLNSGWDVQFFGVQSEGESSKLSFPGPLAGRQVLWRRSPPGPGQKLHFLAFTLATVWRVLGRRPAWVYCSDLMVCPAAWLIGCLTRCRVLYHEHDSPEDDSHPQTRHTSISRFQRFLLWTRKRVGQKADLVVFPNQKRLDCFLQSTRRRLPSLCVFNCPHKDEVVDAVARPEAQGTLRLAFHGSINADRLPMAVLEAMRLFPGRVFLSVVGYEPIGSKGYMAAFLQTADRLGLAGGVEFVGTVPERFEMLKKAAKCHVGLAFMPLRGGDVNMENMTGASNKPFDYLACGLALLVSARPDWEEMFVRSGCGFSCNPDDANAIGAWLKWFLDSPVETREMGDKGRTRILEEWNYENQFKPVLDFLGRNPP